MAIDAAQTVDRAQGTGDQLARGGRSADPAEAFSQALRHATADGELQASERSELRRTLRDMNAATREDTYQQVVRDRASGPTRDPGGIRDFFSIVSGRSEISSGYYAREFGRAISERGSVQAQGAVVEALAPRAGDSELAAEVIGRIAADNAPGGPSEPLTGEPGPSPAREAVAALSEAGTLEDVLRTATRDKQERSGYQVETRLIARGEFDDLVSAMKRATAAPSDAGLQADLFDAATEVFNEHNGRFRNDPLAATDALGVLGGMLLTSEGALDPARAPSFADDSIKDLLEVAIKNLDGNGVVARGSAALISTVLHQANEPLSRFATELRQAADNGDQAKVDALAEAYRWDGIDPDRSELAGQLEAAGLNPDTYVDIASDADRLERAQKLLIDAAGRAAEDRANLSSTVVNIFGSTIFAGVSATRTGEGVASMSPFLADGFSTFVRNRLSPESAGAIGKIPLDEDWQPRSFEQIVQDLGVPRIQDGNGRGEPVQRGALETSSDASELIRDLRQRFHDDVEGYES